MHIISNKRIASPNLKTGTWRLENETVLPRRFKKFNLVPPVERCWTCNISFFGVMPTGIFDPATRTAVKNYQELHNLKPDGIVGSATWASIEGAAVSEEVVYE